jgi:hypothetical protein
MPKHTKATIDAEIEEEEHRDVTLLVDANIPLHQLHARIGRLRARTSRGGEGTMARMEPVPGNGNGTPDRIRIVASY